MGLKRLMLNKFDNSNGINQILMQLKELLNQLPKPSTIKIHTAINNADESLMEAYELIKLL